MSREDDGLLSRWSRRKRAAAEDPAPADAGPQGTDEAAAPPPEQVDPPESDAETLERLGLPDPDTLTEGDDFKAFLRAGIPDGLRRRALRRLWRSNPALANLDGLLDYGGDFTDAAMVPEVLNTAYKVGRGFLRDMLDEDETESDAAPDPGDQALAAAPDPADGTPDPGPDAPAEAAEPAPQAEKTAYHMPDPAPGDDPPAPAPRRMKFSLG